MFKKILAKIGVGGAEVDTVLRKTCLMPGEWVAGEVIIRGGDVEQEIEGLKLRLMTQVEVEEEDQEFLQNYCIESWELNERFKLGAHEERIFPFEIRIHPETPITSLNTYHNRTKVWLGTDLEIDYALDAEDKDYLQIEPTPAMCKLLEAMQHLGFNLKSADVEKGYLRGPNFESISGCYQELEYAPSASTSWRLQEVEVSMIPEETRTHVLLELDRRFSGDGYQALTLMHDDLDLETLIHKLEACLF